MRWFLKEIAIKYTQKVFVKISLKLPTYSVKGFLIIPNGQEKFFNISKNAPWPVVGETTVGSEEEHPFEINRLAVELPQFESWIKIDEQDEFFQAEFIDKTLPFFTDQSALDYRSRVKVLCKVKQKLDGDPHFFLFF